MTIKTMTNYRKTLSILKGRSAFARKLGNEVKQSYRRYRTPKHQVLAIGAADVTDDTQIGNDAFKRVVELADKVTFEFGVLRLYFVL